MPFNFDIKNTSALKALNLSSFPLFKYSGFLMQLFLCLFIFALAGFFLNWISTEILIFNFILFILFLEIYLFNELKIKNIEIVFPISEAISNHAKFNLAEALSLDSCKIIESTIKNCKKRLWGISSEAIFYFSLIESKGIQLLIFRLGIDLEKLKNDLKNYLEKSRFKNDSELSKSKINFSKSFEKIIIESVKISAEAGHDKIGEKEILISLAKNDDFFKQVLIEAELKDRDVLNICYWLDSLEKKIKENKKFWAKDNLSRIGSLGKDFASGFTFTLDQFSFNWREYVRKNVFSEVVGHQKEIDQLEVILSKSNLSNALIIGDEGVGKKSIIQALAERCYLGTSLPELNDKRVVELDMVALISRIQDQETL